MSGSGGFPPAILVGTEIRTFTRTYWVPNKFNKTWYGAFFSNSLYRAYYKFLDRVFAKHNKTYATAFTRDARKYQTLRRTWKRDRTHFTRAA